jgi:hypothetical protein
MDDDDIEHARQFLRDHPDLWITLENKLLPNEIDELSKVIAKYAYDPDYDFGDRRHTVE